MSLTRSQLNELSHPETFLWATGIEDTFITEPWPKTGRTLDEYELTDHYRRFRADMGLMGELGVRTVRYGIPWHLVNPRRNRWDWSFADESLEHLLALGIDPIVDLVHYGLPSWIDGAFLNPSFPDYMAEYAGRLAARFKGRIHLYTPLNEPRVTAWYCGKLGWWPPFLRGWPGFVKVTEAVCSGIVKTVRALEAVDQENVIVHVDATDLYETEDPSLEEEVARRQNIVFLALDLISGRVDREHALRPWVEKFLSAKDLSWFQQDPVELRFIGINLYPMFSRKILTRSDRGVRMRMPYASAVIIDRLADLYWKKYQVPIFISETASVDSIGKRQAWLESSVAAVRRVRESGIPLVGYTWWPMFALVTWAYRQGSHPPDYYLKQMGLWDLAADLSRVETPLVAAYRDLIQGGHEAVGRLELKEERQAYVS